MRKRIIRTTDYASLLVLLLGGLWLALDAFLSADHWLEVRSVVVEGGPAGAEVTLAVDRTIHRPFDGRYDVYIRTYPSLSAHCEASGALPYDSDATLPDPVTLTWWAFSDKRCHGPNLPSGSYSMTTCWTVELPLGLDRRICIGSPVFQIGEAEDE